MKNNTIKNIETMKNMKSENSLMWNENNELLNSLNLEEGEINGQIYMFNLYLDALINERYDDCMDYLREFKDEYDDIETPFTTLDYGFDFEEEWIEYVVNVAGWTREQALIVYNSEYGLDIYNEDDICQYIYDTFNNVDDISAYSCLVYYDDLYYAVYNE